MSNDRVNSDEATGHVREAAGAVIGNDELRNEGNVDHAAAGVKDAVNGVADKVKSILHRGNG